MPSETISVRTGGPSTQIRTADYLAHGITRIAIKLPLSQEKRQTTARTVVQLWGPQPPRRPP